jgi:3-deoxy-7-phosphoheptulonate synthase
MRVYFEKPRTTLGWKGMINDPQLDGSCDLALGLTRARELLCAVNELGVPCATELLDPIVRHYVGDLLAWAAIGARTSESQIHREMASGLALPVGIKNPTSGELGPAADAVVAAHGPHRHLGVAANGGFARIATPGNPDAHLILRGGASGPNYGAREIARGAARLAPLGLARPILVDCSHDNSGKDAARQGAVCRAVLAQLGDGPPGALLGLLIESFLEPGRQTWRKGEPLARGVSITDACIGWSETETLLGEIAQAVRGRA